MKPGAKLSKQIIKILKSHGWWATPVSANMNVGIPDVLATRPGGSLHIEVKALGDTLRDSQINWMIDYCKQTGGAVYMLSERKWGDNIAYSVHRFSLESMHAFATKDTLDEAVEAILNDAKSF